MIENETTTLVNTCAVGRQGSRRYPRETTRPPNTAKAYPHLLSPTIDDRISGGGDDVDLLLENVHPQIITWINSLRNQVEQFLRSSVASVIRWNGYKWCQTESTRIDYTITRIHILYSHIGYQNDQSPGFRRAPRLRARLSTLGSQESLVDGSAVGRPPLPSAFRMSNDLSALKRSKNRPLRCWIHGTSP